MNKHGITIKHIEALADSYRRNEGAIEVQSGVWLDTAEAMIAEQTGWDDGDEAKDMDFSACEFWITTSDGQGPFGIDTHEVIDVFGRMEGENVRVFNADSSVCTRLYVMGRNLYDENSGRCTAYEHPEGIVISLEEARDIDLKIED